jgi:hypothetical protein
VPPGVPLAPLPPYAFELNLVERIWLFLRVSCFSHRLLKGYDAVVSPCCEARNALTP